MSKVFVSIIIPAYREAGEIGKLVRFLMPLLKADGHAECLVIDAGSDDGTEAEAREAGAVVLQSPRKGRAAQMNYGAAQSRGALLYFLHADSYPPAGFLDEIRARAKEGRESGCYRLAFDEPHAVMRLYAWFTRFDLLPFRFGDQSLFVTREVFDAVGRFDESLVVMEDNELVRLLRKRNTFVVMPGEVTTSARKYRQNGFVRLQFIFAVIFVLHYGGASQQLLVQFYRDSIRQNKI
ncbi:MAG: TIGR04283 family arsenosugar biosynthesis glycosyltransferase [Candidatus Cyclonatronum sp.]|uniref:TIGR04283 family arsenosugar biosynthesis glycosyltransferase n=1 Tax=Cyclonatronum sp. TaxID=3024185 RepID=UPI0025C4ED54|nr:TIGR04283 family arsenosugar biosynthesis glycosyltransferase [Cyclonatronum sp.]MCH8487205.1 TIGR04283 family arsenosugar biosynthesis glycosyltransferase [Cyclonatronum sp.]